MNLKKNQPNMENYWIVFSLVIKSYIFKFDEFKKFDKKRFSTTETTTINSFIFNNL